MLVFFFYFLPLSMFCHYHSQETKCKLIITSSCSSVLAERVISVLFTKGLKAPEHRILSKPNPFKWRIVKARASTTKSGRFMASYIIKRVENKVCYREKSQQREMYSYNL